MPRQRSKWNTAMERPAASVSVGDTIWAPDDGDWLLVHRIVDRIDYGEVTFLRVDGSEATFDVERAVLVK